MAVLPLIAGLTGEAFYDPAEMADGFAIAMIACAGLAALGGLLAWLTISDDVLHAEPKRRGELPHRVSTDFSCSVAGTPLSGNISARRGPAPDLQPGAHAAGPRR